MKDIIYRELAQAIKRCRKGRLTQAQLAAKISVSRASLANIEAGRQKVLVHHLYAIAEALDLESPSALLPPLSLVSSPQRDPALAVRLPEEGLNEKQRHEVLRLMDGTQVAKTEIS